MTCREVLTEEFNLTISLGDSHHKKVELQLNSSEMLIEGDQIKGRGFQDYCYLPVFS